MFKTFLDVEIRHMQLSHSKFDSEGTEHNGHNVVCVVGVHGVMVHDCVKLNVTATTSISGRGSHSFK
jgi:hypothetical protein